MQPLPAIRTRLFFPSIPNRVLLCSLLALLLAAPARAAELHGTVVGVADGDSITVLDAAHRRHKVRLAAIDAPERRQPFGTRAKQNLSALVLGRNVTVIWDKRDRYRRIIGKVLAPECAHSTCQETIDAGLAQISAGYAWHYRRYAKEQSLRERQHYAVAEHTARKKQEGLWQDSDPVAPWEFRRASRNDYRAAPARAIRCSRAAGRCRDTV